MIRPDHRKAILVRVRAAGGARGGGRALVLPDPARRVQRPRPFRGVPVDARHRPQHPVEPPRPAGRARHPAARARSGRPAQGRLPADRQGPRPAAGADRAEAMGRKVDFRHAQQSGAGRPAEPASGGADSSARGRRPRAAAQRAGMARSRRPARAGRVPRPQSGARRTAAGRRSPPRRSARPGPRRG